MSAEPEPGEITGETNVAVETQEQSIDGRHELAKKRHQEEEDRLEAEKQERLQTRLAQLEAAGKMRASGAVFGTPNKLGMPSMSDADTFAANKKNPAHKRSHSDPSCTHDQLAKRPRTDVATMKASATRILDESDVNSKTDHSEPSAHRGGPSDGPGSGVDKHATSGAAIVDGARVDSDKENALTEAASAGENASLSSLRALNSDIQRFLGKYKGDGVVVKQERDAEDGQRSIDIFGISSTRAQLAEDSTMDPGRASMIAATSTPQQLKTSRFDPQLGPLKSGANTMPLPPREPANVPQLSGERQTSVASQVDNKPQILGVNAYAVGPPSIIGHQPHTFGPQYNMGLEYPQYYRPAQYQATPQYLPVPEYAPAMQHNVAPQFNSAREQRYFLRTQQRNKGKGQKPKAGASQNGSMKVKHTNKAAIWNKLKNDIRGAVDLAGQDHITRQKRDKNIDQAFNALHPLIIGASVVHNSNDEDEDGKGAPGSGHDAKPFITAFYPTGY